MLRDKRILVIDSSATALEHLRTVLTNGGGAVTTAATAQDGIELWERSGSYDLVLVDLLLPDRDGIDVLKRIRQEDSKATIVVVSDTEDVRLAIDATRQGADAFVQRSQTSPEGSPSVLLHALERAFERRAGALAQQQLEVMRADFYSMIAHDLRNPAGCIQTSCQLLASGEVGKLNPAQAEIVSIISKSADKITSLIGDYLDYAMIDAGYLHLNLENIDLRELVTDAVRTFRPQTRSRHQTLRSSIPRTAVWVCADRERLQQVLDNLLSNASKYTPEGGSIAARLRQADGQAFITIRDTGIGIPADELPELFAKYHRVPGKATHGIDGTGLGLLIVKRIVEAHGGTVHAESEGSDMGSSFTVSLPLVRHETETPRAT